MSKDPRAEPDSSNSPSEPDEPKADPPRSTLVPSFDVETFARAVDVGQPRAPQLTITNEEELEEARQASMRSELPPARARAHSDAEIELSTADVVIDDLSGLVPMTPAGSMVPLRSLDPELVLGDLNRIPRLLVAPGVVPGLGLDHHAGFMLALVDSVLTYDTILDVCGMPRKEALGVLARLVERRIIGA
jgi:hypothetical protein